MKMRGMRTFFRAFLRASALLLITATSWSQSITWLGTLDGVASWASSVSADGTVVVGGILSSSNRLHAFRWTAARGMRYMGDFGGGESWASDVSADGSVVVGEALAPNGRRHAFRWTQVGGMRSILALGSTESYAEATSADGSVIVGAAYIRHYIAFRWTTAGVLQDLGRLPGGGISWAFGVSEDGSVVVGAARNASDLWRAFRWTQAGEMEDLNQTYASLLTSNSYLKIASALSPDGRYIVGWGFNAATGHEETFLLDTWRTGDTNGDGCIDDTDLLKVLFAFGTPGTGYTRHEDINKDGIVDDADLLIVLSNFGSGC